MGTLCIAPGNPPAARRVWVRDGGGEASNFRCLFFGCLVVWLLGSLAVHISKMYISIYLLRAIGICDSLGSQAPDPGRHRVCAYELHGHGQMRSRSFWRLWCVLFAECGPPEVEDVERPTSARGSVSGCHRYIGTCIFIICRLLGSL